VEPLEEKKKPAEDESLDPMLGKPT
jgi:hypothetical protein